MKILQPLIATIFLAACLLAGCSRVFSPTRPASKPQEISGFSPIGHWEFVRQVSYDGIPKENLKGELGPAYSTFMVTMAGFQTESYGLSIGPDDDVRYTLDGGQSWTRAHGELFCRHGMDIVDEKVAWHCGNGGTRRSTDGGQTWKTVTPSLCPYMSFLNEKTGWAASADAIQVTNDGGAIWNSISLPEEAGEITAIDLRTDRAGYFLNTAGRLFATKDGGQQWQAASIGLKTGEKMMTTTEGPKAALRFVDDRNGILVFDLSDQSVWLAVTADGGQTWQRAEITELRGQSYYYHLFISRDGRLLTITDDFNNGKNISSLYRYQQP